MSDRKLATIRKIDEIRVHENADSLELLIIDGWQVVAQKGIHTVGDYVIYFEIDSWIPTEVAPFLSKGKEPKEYEGIKGERLRTIRLRGQLSQGLVIPLSEDIVSVIMSSHKFNGGNFYLESLCVIKEFFETKFDLSEILNIKKYEKPIPANLSGVVKGNFPSFISKTDQERIQNLWKEYKEKYNDIDWEVSIKLDGTSFTCYYNEGKFGVCSRNLELIEDDNNSYWKIARYLELEEKLKDLGRNLAIQGELIGEGIQQNIDGIKGHNLLIFDIYNIDKKVYLNHEERFEILRKLDLQDNTIKLVGKWFYKLSEFEKIEDILKFADGKSINSDIREGLVFKSMSYVNGEIISFKVISNKYLEKYE